MVLAEICLHKLSMVVTYTLRLKASSGTNIMSELCCGSLHKKRITAMVPLVPYPYHTIPYHTLSRHEDLRHSGIPSHDCDV
jgi:hypothetical protein